MFQCCSLYSGSSGNSFLITTEKTNILIDVGVSCKKIIDALASFDKQIQDINAILITHEHIDHIRSLVPLSSKFSIPVFTTRKTWQSIPTNKLAKENVNIFEVEQEFNINDLKILPFSTPHDASDPCGFSISKGSKSMCIATDLGYVSPEIFKHFQNSSLLMLESNYDPDILKVSPYPYRLKQRISSNLGHLSNIKAGEIISKLATNNLKKAMLIHLSNENNVPELALTTIKEELIKNNINPLDIDICVAPRNNPSNIMKVG